MRREGAIAWRGNILPAFFATFCLASAASGASYYVDAGNGSDGNPGTRNAPWQSVAKVNAFPFVPGDRIYFKAGTVFTTPLIPRSGSRRRQITYQAYGAGAMPVLESCVLHGVHHVTIDGLQFLSHDNTPVDLQNASHNTIENCAIYADAGNSAAWTALWLRDGSSYNRILNNTVERRNLLSQGNALTVVTNTDHNLIEGNRLGSATHYSLDIIGAHDSTEQGARYNVIRHNVIENPEGALSEMIMNADHNLFEGNMISGGKSTRFDAHAAVALALGGSHNIIRNNLFTRNPSGSGYGVAVASFASGGLSANVVGNRIYNNTISKIAGRPLFLENYGSSSIGDNVFKNNLIADNGTLNGIQMTATASAGSYFFANNLIYQAGRSLVLEISSKAESVSSANYRYRASFSGNLQHAPLLDASYRPLAGSPARNGGTHLTTVTGVSGGGRTITVRDASYFTDGFGVIEGDTIMVGKATAKIKSIDYRRNTIKLSGAISCKSGDPVSLPYGGDKPDIGAALPAPGRNSAGGATAPTTGTATGTGTGTAGLRDARTP